MSDRAAARPPPAPVTARLALRALVPGDAPTFAARAGDRRVARFLLASPSPYPLDLARAWIRRRMAWWDEGRGLTLAITRRDQGPRAPLLGTVSLRAYPRDRRAELGYWLGHDAWGQGLATEAAAAMLAVGFRDLDLRRIYAHAFATNLASRRVLTKIGLRDEGVRRQHLRHRGRYHDVASYGLLRDEWVAGGG